MQISDGQKGHGKSWVKQGQLSDRGSLLSFIETGFEPRSGDSVTFHRMAWVQRSPPLLQRWSRTPPTSRPPPVRPV